MLGLATKSHPRLENLRLHRAAACIKRRAGSHGEDRRAPGSPQRGPRFRGTRNRLLVRESLVRAPLVVEASNRDPLLSSTICPTGPISSATFDRGATSGARSKQRSCSRLPIRASVRVISASNMFPTSGLPSACISRRTLGGRLRLLSHSSWRKFRAVARGRTIASDCALRAPANHSCALRDSALCSCNSGRRAGGG